VVQGIEGRTRASKRTAGAASEACRSTADFLDERLEKIAAAFGCLDRKDEASAWRLWDL